MSAVFDGKTFVQVCEVPHTQRAVRWVDIWAVIVDSSRLEKPVILKLFKHALKLKRKKG